jgi:hypothetical protein
MGLRHNKWPNFVCENNNNNKIYTNIVCDILSNRDKLYMLYIFIFL